MMFVFAAIAVNAASFTWAAANIYGSDLTTKWAGTVTLYCAEVASFSQTATASSGAVSKNATEFSDASFVAGNDYNFYIVVEDGDYTFTSAYKNVGAQQSDVANIAFGNMATQTQNANNWASSAVPEPTSGLLMLLGMAGLALRRKRA